MMNVLSSLRDRASARMLRLQSALALVLHLSPTAHPVRAVLRWGTGCRRRLAHLQAAGLPD